MEWKYRCIECGKSYEISPDIMLCPGCKKKYDPKKPLRGILEVVGKTGELSAGMNLPAGPDTVDFVHRFLPVEREYFPSIPVGNTPIWRPMRLRKKTGFENLYLKDDTLNPTGSLKDRASFLVSAFARKFHIQDVVVASTGNAASSMAGIGAAAGLNIRIFIPSSAPKAKMVQALQYGADVTLVDGTYDTAFDMSIEFTDRHGGLNRNTAFNPMTIEGKKTAALEIFAQLNRMPDYVFVPAGDGVILSGVYKGFKDIIGSGPAEEMPVIYAVQAEGSQAICRALRDGDFGEPERSSTIADSIAVEVPRGGYYALSSLKKYSGRCVTVSDDEILKAQHELASESGLFAEPSSSAAFAGFKKVKAGLSEESVVVLLITGSGLKDIDAAMKGIDIPQH